MRLLGYYLPGGAARAQRLVRSGYDEMAAEYLGWSRSAGSNRKRDLWAAAVADGVPAGAELLDLGCGPGQELAVWGRRGISVTGVDISQANLTLARQHVPPDATLLCADMTTQNFAPSSFDLVVAFYSLIHVPRRRQSRVLRRAHDWLKPGGIFIGNVAARRFPAMHDPNWLGTPMFWSSLGAAGASRRLTAAGFSLLRTELATENDFGHDNTFFWFVAQKEDAGINPPGWTTTLVQALARHDPPL